MNFIFQQLSVTQKNKNNSLIFLLILIFFSSALETISIGMIIPLVTNLNENWFSNHSFFFNDIIYSFANYLGIDLSSENKFLFFIIIVFTIILTIKSLTIIFITFKKEQFKYHIVNNLSKKIFANYLSKSYNFFSQENSSTLLRNCTHEVEIFAKSSLAMVNLINELFLLIFIGIFLIIFSFKVTIFIIAFFSALILLYIILTNKKVTNLGKNRQKYRGQHIKNVRESFGAVKEIIIYDKFFYFIEQFKKSTSLIGKNNLSSNVLRVIPRLFIEYFAIIFVFFIIGSNLILFDNLETFLLNLTIFLAAGIKLLPALNKILTFFQEIKLSKPAIDLIFKHSKEEAIEKTIFENKEIIKFNKKIEIKNLSFSYNKDKIILNNLNFDILKGKIIGIFGKSGCGKSTLMDIICGLHANYTGQILIDSVAMKENQAWKKNIGYVPQFTYILDENFEKNIAFGEEDNKIDKFKLNNAIMSSGLSDIVNAFQEKEKKEIGEKGLVLSGGERQRVGIARALYNDPDLIILDESLNALDLATEIKIINLIKKLQKTVIIISHRKSTLDQCDEVYELKNKTIYLSR